jgi:predicted TIM-barrel enzyme
MQLDVIGGALDSIQAVQDVATLGGTIVVRKVGGKVVKEVSKQAVKKLIKEKIKEYVKDKLKGVVTDAIKDLLDDPLNAQKACRALAECEAARGVSGKSVWLNAVGNEVRKCEWNANGWAWKVYGWRYTLPKWAGGWDW